MSEWLDEKQFKKAALAAAGVDPYRDLVYDVGDKDDFICFGYGMVGSRFVFQSVVNSETGHFIEEFDYTAYVDKDDAAGVAIRLVNHAHEWCADNDVEVDHEGWGYSAAKFIEDVKAAVEDDETPNPFEIGVQK